MMKNGKALQKEDGFFSTRKRPKFALNEMKQRESSERSEKTRRDPSSRTESFDTREKCVWMERSGRPTLQSFQEMFEFSHIQHLAEWWQQTGAAHTHTFDRAQMEINLILVTSERIGRNFAWKNRWKGEWEWPWWRRKKEAEKMLLKEKLFHSHARWCKKGAKKTFPTFFIRMFFAAADGHEKYATDWACREPLKEREELLWVGPFIDLKGFQNSFFAPHTRLHTRRFIER